MTDADHPDDPSQALLEGALGSAVEALLGASLDGDPRGSVERLLVRIPVEAGWADAAALWTGQGGCWSPLRGFGGRTPAPYASADSGADRTWRLSDSLALVVRHDGWRPGPTAEAIEDAIQALVTLAVQLVDLGSETDREPPSALPEA